MTNQNNKSDKIIIETPHLDRKVTGSMTNPSKPVFDLSAALSVGDSAPAWDPTSFTTDFVHKLADARESMKPIKYIMGNDGQVYEMRSTSVGEFIVKTNKVIGADSVQEGFSLNVPKIPFRLLLQTVSFFRDVCDQFNNDEAMLQYWFDTEKQEYFAVCLEQTTNKVHVTYLRNEELEQDPTKVLVMDIHSHNNMEAFFSGTDDASEQETRLYGVVGRLDKEIPDLRFRFSVEGKFVEIPMTSVVEMPVMKVMMSASGYEEEISLPVTKIFFPQVDFPKEWLETIEAGKRSMQRFNGKGNPRRQGSLSPQYGRVYRGTSQFDENDVFTSADQLTLFETPAVGRPNPEHLNYQQSALRNREGFGHDQFEEEDEFGEEREDQFLANEELLSEFVDELASLEDDPEARVGIIAAVVSNFTMFEVKMLVDRMLEIGYDQEIIDQIKESGYEVRRRS